MLAQGLSLFKNTPLSVLGMLLFFGVFILVTMWTYSGARKRDFYDGIASQPLNDDREKGS